jgi:putative Holliday junction resolvase
MSDRIELGAPLSLGAPSSEGKETKVDEEPPQEQSTATPPISRSSFGSLLGIDFGTKRIGLAVSDPDRVIASPLETRANDSGVEQYFIELTARSRFAGIVVGLPLHANGDESEMSLMARRFAGRLAELTKLPVVMWDERCTSAAAEDALRAASLSRKKRKARVDRVAAQMILQTYLDAKCPAGA